MASSSQQPPPPHPPPPIPSLPSDIELTKMLRARVDPSATPPGNNSLIIHEADVYAQDPADLTLQFEPAVAEDGQQAWYFFTELLPKSQRGKRKRRCMDSGVWHGEGKSKTVVAVSGSEAQVTIGHRNLFAFVNKIDGKKDRTGWIMHEFRLHVPDGNEESFVVLCKVFRSSRRCAPVPPMNNESATTAEAQAREAAVEAREVAELQAVPAREAELQAPSLLTLLILVAREPALLPILISVAEAALALRALAAREAALAAREAPLTAREAAWAAREAAREALVRRDAAELAGEADLAAREAEREQLVRRDAEQLAVLERNLSLQERGRNLAAGEETRLQAIYEELEEELEAFVLMIMMAAALLVPRAVAPSVRSAACPNNLRPSFSNIVNWDNMHMICKW